ncbi:hypothetical protein BDK88_2768 [Natrinema hispanicum]|uniref:Uncharacterized protein n=1 Tax=Natrinema hispanicum TaxID=392421 RepID=A0A482Y9K2_9EURY|nr:hypothetical protein [Natrinema hispanicum]RZV08694.1 hypothetical protein BDK88_2768 [Natrinema hispanicum]
MKGNSNPQYGLKLGLGTLLAGIGVVTALETNAGLESVSVLWLGLSAGFGLVAAVADAVEPLRRALERGLPLITGSAVFVVFAIMVVDPPLSLLLGALFGLSGGVIVGSIGASVLKPTVQQCKE